MMVVFILPEQRHQRLGSGFSQILMSLLWLPRGGKSVIRREQEAADIMIVT